MKTGPLFVLHATTALVVTAVAVLLITGDRKNPRIDIPDEKAAGMALLAQKLSGPGYFHPAPAPFSTPGYLSPVQAHGQVKAVVQERQWSEDKEARVHELIDEVVEPAPYRMVRSERVNLTRLNLALDALR